MDNKAFYKLSYGVFVLSTKTDKAVNGCITNTCIQVANSPTRIAISVINTNYTCDLIKESGIFAVTLLDKTVTFETIKHFGMQSGRDVDKFANITPPEDINGIPYLGWQSCAVLSAKVVDKMDLGSHTMFIGEVLDAKVLSENEPLTYDYYQSVIKPKPQAPKEDRPIIGYKCKICGYEYMEPVLPADYICPLCGHGAEDFEPIYGG